MFGSLFSSAGGVNITPEDAHSRQKAGAIIIDVREPAEWRDGHIPGARHIPLASLSLRLKELSRSKEIIAVCRSGSRSGAAVQFLQRSGFTDVKNLSGGMIAWTRKQLPVSR